MAVGEDNWCVARTSVVYGWGRPHRPNAATYVYDKLSKKENILMVRDQFSSPTLNTNLANMLVEIAERRILGTIHVSGATRINRYDFAIALAHAFGLERELVKPVETTSQNWKAKRPRDSSLNVSKAMRLLENKPLSVDVAITQFKQEHIEHPPHTYL